MEAPEKIYVALDEIYDLALDHRFDYPTCVEYTRTDAFIEKACEFLKDRIEHDSIDYPMATKHLVEDFKNYIEE